MWRRFGILSPIGHGIGWGEKKAGRQAAAGCCRSKQPLGGLTAGCIVAAFEPRSLYALLAEALLPVPCGAESVFEACLRVPPEYLVGLVGIGPYFLDVA